MKLTKKIITTGIACWLGAGSLLAGGLMTNTNQSAHFLRNPARGASMEIDAVYTNPAGLSHLSREGFHFTFNNQSAFQTRTITTTFAPFAFKSKEYRGEASALFIPSFFGAYKMGDWVFSGGFAITGGGGTLTFDHGLPSFERDIVTLPMELNRLNPDLNVTQHSVDMRMQGTSIIYGGQLGASYSINDMFSVFAGARLAVVNNSHKGHLRDIKINPTFAGNPNGDMMLASDFFNMIGEPEQADAAADRHLDNTQSGWGITPILGVNINFGNLNIGIKYEFNTRIDVANSTARDIVLRLDIDGNPVTMFPDGGRVPHDIPALLAIGAQYDVHPDVTISAGWHRFFDSNARMANDRQDLINGGINEYLVGVEWRINSMFLASAGGQFTHTGVTPRFQTDLSHSLHSFSFGMGGAVNVTDRIRINAGYFLTLFADWTNISIFPGTYVVWDSDVFSRTSRVFGVGVDFRF